MSFNLFPRNKNDDKKNVQAVLNIHHIFIEYSNDLARNLITTALTYVSTLQLKLMDGIAINPDIKAIQKKMQFYSKMKLIKENFVDEIL